MISAACLSLTCDAIDVLCLLCADGKLERETHAKLQWLGAVVVSFILSSHLFFLVRLWFVARFSGCGFSN